MHLTITEAAAALGWTRRQVRYAIQQGRLPAQKAGGRWRIDPADLPLTDAQRRGLTSRSTTVRQAVEDALAPGESAAAKAGKRRYSVRDLRAFSVGAPILRDAEARLGVADPAVAALREALDLLVRGCHTFRRADKAERYAAARERAAGAVASLLLDGPEEDTDRQTLADRLEQELLPEVSGLVRAAELRSLRAQLLVARELDVPDEEALLGPRE